MLALALSHDFEILFLKRPCLVLCLLNSGVTLGGLGLVWPIEQDHGDFQCCASSNDVPIQVCPLICVCVCLCRSIWIGVFEWVFVCAWIWVYV